MSLATEVPGRIAQTSTPIHPVLAERWSPRSYDPDAPLDETKLVAALEAARWSASAGNTQPWRFIVARRGTEAFDKVVGALMGFNTVWAASAGALIVGLAEKADSEGQPRRWGQYDLGQAFAHLSVQAHLDGLHVHQMGGFVAEDLRAAFDIDERYEVVTVSAVGTLGEADALPDPLRERELAPRTRLPLDELILVNQ